MATTVDRTRPPKPARPPQKTRPPKPTPRWTGPQRPPGRPTGRHERRLARFYMVSALAAGALALLAVAAVVLAVVLALGSGEAPPATGAAELVPANALLYVHLSTDSSRPAVQRALALSRRLPGSAPLLAGVGDRIDAILSGSSTPGFSFASDVRPWLGKEAALAVLNTPGSSAGTLVVLDVRDQRAARRFLSRVGARPDGRYRGVQLLAEPSGAVLAFIRHYLVLGQLYSVESALDVASGQVASLAASPQYQAAAGTEPADRVLDAYGSAAGIRRALVPRSGLLGDLGALLDQPALSAAAVSVSPVATGLRVDVHSALVPKLARLSPPAQFSPTLDSLFPAGSALLLDVKGLRASVPKLLGVAARAGIGGRIGPLLSRLGSALAAEGVDLRQILGIFAGETAMGVVDGPNGGAPTPVIVTRTQDQAQTREELAGLEGPLTQVFAPPSSGPGQVPVLSDLQVAGVPVHQVALAPGFSLDFAVARGLVVLSTGQAGIAGVFSRVRALNQTPSYQSVLADHPSPVGSLVFLDLGQLLRLGSRIGLIGSARQATLWPALEKIHAVGLAAWRGADDTTTTLQFQIP